METPIQDVVVNVDVDLTPIINIIEPHLETIIKQQEHIIYNQQYQTNLIYVIAVMLTLAYIINFFYKLLNKF